MTQFMFGLSFGMIALAAPAGAATGSGFVLGSKSGGSANMGRAGLFLQHLRAIDALEAMTIDAADSNTPSVSAGPLEWAPFLEALVPSAHAARACMVAGYVGSISSNGSCLKAEVRAGLEAGKIRCNPDIFGELVIDKPGDSRWTRACGGAFLKKAGISKAIDAALSPQELERLGGYLDDLGLPRGSIYREVQGLCKTAGASNRAKDIADCRALDALYSKLSDSYASSGDENCCEPAAGGPKVAIAPPAVQGLVQNFREKIYQFDPERHLDCNQETPADPGSYGLAHIANLAEYEKRLGKNVKGKICYQRAFMDQAAREVSEQLKQAQFASEGTAIKVTVGTCEIDLNYLGTDLSRYRKNRHTEDTRDFVMGTIRTKKALGAKTDSATPYIFATLFLKHQGRFMEGTKTTESLFAETFHRGYQNYSEVLEAHAKDRLAPSPSLMKELVWFAYNHCRFSKR